VCNPSPSQETIGRGPKNERIKGKAEHLVVLRLSKTPGQHRENRTEGVTSTQDLVHSEPARVRCGDGIIATNGAQVSRAITQRCHAWTCEHCADARRRGLIALACAGEPTRFLTFTIIHTPGGDPLKGARLLTSAFRIFLKLLKRRYPKQRLEYLAVMEAHKDGWPHLHVLARGPWIDIEWMREQWKRLTGAHRIGLVPVDGVKRLAAYVSKYLGKAPHRFGTLKRYWQSRAYDKRKKHDKGIRLEIDEVWFRSFETLREWTQKRVLARCTLTWIRDEYVVAARPP